MAVDAGADALGFNFYPQSPRYIEPSVADDIMRELPDGVLTVGVFVNSDVEAVRAIASECSLRMLQLHGDEDREFVAKLRREVEARIMKVIRIGRAPESAIAHFPADEFLLDSDSAVFGGSGETFDWREAIELKRTVPEFYLAGGLTPENVGDAVRQVRPAGVDVCSGVEQTKRKKDPKKIVDFIKNARSAL